MRTWVRVSIWSSMILPSLNMINVGQGESRLMSDICSEFSTAQFWCLDFLCPALVYNPLWYVECLCLQRQSQNKFLDFIIHWVQVTATVHDECMYTCVTADCKSTEMFRMTHFNIGLVPRHKHNGISPNFALTFLTYQIQNHLCQELQKLWSSLHTPTVNTAKTHMHIHTYARTHARTHTQMPNTTDDAVIMK